MATVEERIKALEEKEKQLKAQRLDLLSRQKEKERKERTRRLIEKGAVLESVFQCESWTPEETKIALEKLRSLPGASEIFKKGVNHEPKREDKETT